MKTQIVAKPSAETKHPENKWADFINLPSINDLSELFFFYKTFVRSFRLPNCYPEENKRKKNIQIGFINKINVFFCCKLGWEIKNEKKRKIGREGRDGKSFIYRWGRGGLWCHYSRKWSEKLPGRKFVGGLMIFFTFIFRCEAGKKCDWISIRSFSTKICFGVKWITFQLNIIIKMLKY